MAGKSKGKRLTFSTEELHDYYSYLGGRIGALKDGAAIRDQRPSVIQEEVTRLRMTQDRIAEALAADDVEEKPAVQVVAQPVHMPIVGSGRPILEHEIPQ